MRVLGIDHLQLAVPKGSEDRARGFYGEVLGTWGAEEDFRPAKKAHPHCSSRGWTRYSRKCQAAGLPTKPDVQIDGRRRARL